MVRMVHDYYWTYTAADDADGKVSIENLQRIVERITRKKIKIDLVDFAAQHTRAELERFDDHFEIHIRKTQPEEWYRMAAVKEFWHALSDQGEDLSTDGVKTIRDMVKAGRQPSWDKVSPQVRSEKLAETFALELLYPLEYRKTDIEKLGAGTTLEEISKARGVPISLAEDVLDKEYYEACVQMWEEMDGTPKYPPLAPLEGEVS
jgi:Zn-dependent peptidase ImmA (M78 family)